MVTINESRCIGCGACVSDCVAQVLSLSNYKATVHKDCIYCGHCVAVCPSEAISIPEYDMEDVETYKQSEFALNSNSLLRAIKYRRSIRNYKNMPVPGDALNQIVQAGRYTATAVNRQNCHFAIVQEELETFKEMAWDFIETLFSDDHESIPKDMLFYDAFLKRKKIDTKDDYLFRNAPAVVFISSSYPLDAGLAAQSMELMAVSNNLGMLYNGYLCRLVNNSPTLKSWLAIGDRDVCVCMLLGYPNVNYKRTAPRKEANVSWL